MSMSGSVTVPMRATPEAIQLLDAIDGLPTRGLAVSFGEGGDDDAALDAVVRSAGVAIGHGATVEGYCYSTSSDVAELVAEGRLRPIVHEVMPLADVARAHALMEDSGHTGKILLTP